MTNKYGLEMEMLMLAQRTAGRLSESSNEF
jgi:hypothetical protein